MSRMGPREPRPIEVRPRLSIDNLLWVANTRHGPGGHWYARVTAEAGDHDHLVEPSDAVDYLERHRVPLPSGTPGESHLESLAAIRAAIQDLADPTRPSRAPDVGDLFASTRFRIRPDGAIRAEGSGWDRFVGDLLLLLVPLINERNRVRRCGNPRCRLIFLDLSRNHSRRWCDTAGCGNRDRVRRHRNAQRPPA